MEKVLKLAHVKFNMLSKNSLLQIDESIKLIITVNAQFIVLAEEDKKFKDLLDDNYTTIDGQLIYYLLKLKYWGLKFEKLAGSDIVYDFLNLAVEKKYPVFLLGASKEANQKAIEKCKEKYENLVIEGFSPDYEPYPFSASAEALIFEKLKLSKPKILLVGFGAPKQEYWLRDHKIELAKIGVKWAIGCGGTIDFLSEDVRRAPRWCQLMCLEGIYRFFQEPSLFRFKRIVQSLKIFQYL